MERIRTITAAIVLAACVNASAAEEEDKADGSATPHPLLYINTTFENVRVESAIARPIPPQIRT